MNREIRIGGRPVGPGRRVYIIAEMSANHNRDYASAVRLVREAKKAGADAVKVQTFTPDTITLKSSSRPFRVSGGTLWDGRSLYDLYAEAFMPWDWQPKLKKVAQAVGIDFFSSAFDPTSVDFLRRMGVPAFKVASCEVIDLPLIRRMAAAGKPLILSTGMASLAEITEALEAARRGGSTQAALLKCNSAYPAPLEEMNLATIPDMIRRFRVPVGLSDHTMGIEAACAAVAMGACIVEKHFKLAGGAKGPDSAFSLDPAQFRAMTGAIRRVEAAVGRPFYGVTKSQAASYPFRRSLFVVRGIRKGERFTAGHVRSIRPGQGLAPKHLPAVIGKRAGSDLAAGTPLRPEHVQHFRRGA